jgi:hypothetical protein
VIICAGTSSANAVLDFSYSGQAMTGNPGSNNSFACKSRIACNMNDGKLSFYTQQATTPAMVLDGSTANATLLVGTSTTQSTMKLYVAGNFGASGTKTFDIPHPTKAGFRLRHRCIESPQARLLYEYLVEAQEGPNSLLLPDWLTALNADFAVYCSPFRHFGAAWGEVADGSLQVTANCAGSFRVLLLGTRSDEAATEEWAQHGVEYPSPQ